MAASGARRPPGHPKHPLDAMEDEVSALPRTVQEIERAGRKSRGKQRERGNCGEIKWQKSNAGLIE